MKHFVVLLCCVVLLLMVPFVFAAEPVTVVGTVSITENDDWLITAVKITVDEKTVYNVVLDEQGKQLGSEHNGDRVEVTGTLTMKGDARWITVQTIKELEE